MEAMLSTIEGQALIDTETIVAGEKPIGLDGRQCGNG